MRKKMGMGDTEMGLTESVLRIREEVRRAMGKIVVLEAEEQVL